MGDVLDKLFSVLPVVLAILWILRRTSNRKKKAAARSATAGTGTTGASTVGGNSGGGLKGKVAAGKPEMVHRVKEPTPWPGSQVAVEDPRPAARPISQPEEVERNVGATPTGDQARTVVPGTLERLDRLSPLARGVLWSFILEPPPSLKEPGN